MVSGIEAGGEAAEAAEAAVVPELPFTDACVLLPCDLESNRCSELAVTHDR